jgi:hypothetical protein
MFSLLSRALSRSLALAACLITASTFVAPATPNNPFDPVSSPGTHGSAPQHLFKKQPSKKGRGTWQIAPYTQITKSGLGVDGNEAKLGNRTGTWGMASLAYGLISNPTADAGDQVPVHGKKTDFPYLWASAQNADVKTALPIMTWETRTDGYYSVNFDYSRVGIRSSASFEPVNGFVFSVHGGICDRKISNVKFYDPSESTDTVYDETSSDVIVGSFMKQEARRLIFEELSIDATGFHDVQLEDTIAQVSVYYPFSFEEEDDDERGSIHFLPSITLSAILPTERLGSESTSTTYTRDKILTLPIGNEGFLGGTLEAGFTLDFRDTINFHAAAGYTIYEDRALINQRIPNNEYQSVIYPFKLDITKKRGDSWHLHAAAFSENFIQHGKAFLDYTWVVHRKDTITLKDATLLPTFRNGIIQLEKDSEWSAGSLHCGFSYEMAKGLEGGIAFQTVLHGTRVYKPYHFMASLGLSF